MANFHVFKTKMLLNQQGSTLTFACPQRGLTKQLGEYKSRITFTTHNYENNIEMTVRMEIKKDELMQVLTQSVTGYESQNSTNAQGGWARLEFTKP